MEREYTVNYHKGMMQFVGFIMKQNTDKSGDGLITAVYEASSEFINNGQYMTESKCFYIEGENIRVIEAMYGLSVCNFRKSTAKDMTCESVTDLILAVREALEADPYATCHAYKLRQGWTALDADNVESDEMVTVDDFSTEVYEVEVEDEDGILTVGCVTTLEDARQLKQWADEEGLSLKCNSFEEDFNLFDFLEKTDYRDFWMDYMVGEVEL